MEGPVCPKSRLYVMKSLRQAVEQRCLYYEAGFSDSSRILDKSIVYTSLLVEQMNVFRTRPCEYELVPVNSVEATRERIERTLKTSAPMLVKDDAPAHLVESPERLLDIDPGRMCPVFEPSDGESFCGEQSTHVVPLSRFVNSLCEASSRQLCLCDDRRYRTRILRTAPESAWGGIVAHGPKVWLSQTGAMTAPVQTISDLVFVLCQGRKGIWLFAPQVALRRPTKILRPGVAIGNGWRDPFTTPATVIESGDVVIVPSGWFYSSLALTACLSATYEVEWSGGLPRWKA